MSNLTEIAKENGADDVTTENCQETILMLSDAQLQATVEQVCKPLVDALEESQMTIKGIIDMYIRNRDAINADYWHQVWNINANLIDAYRKLTGRE